MRCADVFHQSKEGFDVGYIDLSLAMFRIDDDTAGVVSVVPRFNQHIDLSTSTTILSDNPSIGCDAEICLQLVGKQARD